MFADRQDGDRFYARLKAFAIECPRCGELYIVGNRTGGPKVYDFKTQRFTCATKACGLHLQLGILAWPILQGTHPAASADTVPTWRQAQRLRELMALGIQESNPRAGKDPVNRTLRGECRCRPLEPRGLYTHPECPVHGAGKRK